jgi:predicted  nucleic acid-binding Zn-ribbon protein
VDAHIAKFESEIEAVRDREDRDRKMLEGGAVSAKQLADLQHELETLERRQSSLEDSLLEVMERREQLQAEQDGELTAIDELESKLAEVQRTRDDALAEIEQSRHQCASRRDELTALLDGDLVALYERQRARGGAGAGRLQGRRCGACHMEIDRGEIARITAAADDEVLRCPECGAILLRVKDGQ